MTNYPTLKYSYFDVPARGEPCRLAMVIGKIPFEDNRVEFTDFPALKPSLPLGSLPILEIDGKVTVTQSVPILRYVGRLANLYPTDLVEAMRVDEVIDTVADFFNGLFHYKGDDQDKLRESREKALAESGSRYWGGCQKIIERNCPDGPFVLGSKVSIADLYITHIYLLFSTRFLSFIPKDALHEYERMELIHDSVMEIPEVVEFYKKHAIPDLGQIQLS